MYFTLYLIFCNTFCLLASPVAQLAQGTRSLDVPVAAYDISFYDVLVVYVSDDFKGATTNLEFYDRLVATSDDPAM